MRATPKGEKSCLWIVFPYLLCIERGVALKIRRKQLLHVKLFFHCFFLEFTYSVFLRHSLDFDGVMW